MLQGIWLHNIYNRILFIFGRMNQLSSALPELGLLVFCMQMCSIYVNWIHPSGFWSLSHVASSYVMNRGIRCFVKAIMIFPELHVSPISTPWPSFHDILIDQLLLGLFHPCVRTRIPESFGYLTKIFSLETDTPIWY